MENSMNVTRMNIDAVVPNCGGEQQDVEIAKAGTWRGGEQQDVEIAKAGTWRGGEQQDVEIAKAGTWR